MVLSYIFSACLVPILSDSFQYGVVLTLVLLTLCVGFGVSFIFREEVSISTINLDITSYRLEIAGILSKYIVLLLHVNQLITTIFPNGFCRIKSYEK